MDVIERFDIARMTREPADVSSETAPLYLHDLGDLVKRSAVQARARRDAALNEAEGPFEAGRLFAYVEVISLMQQQAVAFGIDLTELGLDDIDPERDLL
jgi:hypothetical protein|nr:hypothetical protein GCM10025699_05320 [Microbacterium flavescens]